MSLLPTLPAVMMDVAGEYIVAGEVDQSSVEPHFTAKEAYDALKQDMKSVCQWWVFDVLFEGLLEAVEQWEKDIFDGVQAVNCK